MEHSHIHKILFSPIKQIMWQFKLCGNHLVNMLGLVCGNFGGQGAFGAKVKAAQKKLLLRHGSLPRRIVWPIFLWCQFKGIQLNWVKTYTKYFLSNQRGGNGLQLMRSGGFPWTGEEQRLNKQTKVVLCFYAALSFVIQNENGNGEKHKSNN